MSQADPSPLPTRPPPGIPCPQCGGVVWRVTCTRRVPGGIRRYRTCEGCSRRVTTLEARLSAFASGMRHAVVGNTSSDTVEATPS